MFFRFIKTSTTGVVTRFGRHVRDMSPGLNFYIPFAERVKVVGNRLDQEEFRFEVKTADNVLSELEVKVQYRITAKNSSKAVFSLEEPSKQIDAYVENVVRAAVPKLTLHQLYNEQDHVCREVQRELAEKMEEHGFTIVNTLITSVDPPKSVKDAMNNVYAAERNKEAAKTAADAEYFTLIRKAEADKERKRLLGEGIHEQRKAILSGQREMADSIGVTPEKLLDFLLRSQHMDTLAVMGASNATKTVFVQHTPQSFMESQEVESMKRD